jgi:hypothetical protein
MTTTTASSDLLIRSEIWSNELKEVLQDSLFAMQFVDTLVDFPDGNTFTIPSIGEAQVDDYVEDTDATYRPLDTGEWQFTIDEYIQSGTYITRKNEQDMYYMNQLVSGFVPKQERAIMKHVEATILQKPEDILGASANSNYVINGADHRYAGSGTGGVVGLEDFAYAKYALKKANVPDTNMVAILPPEAEVTINTLTNLVDVSNNPRWEGIVSDNIVTGMKFMKNIYGFDVYISNYLPQVLDGALPTSERGGTVAANTNVDFSSGGKACYFFSAASDVLPWKMAWRQPPSVDSEYDMDKQRTKFLTTGRYGAKLYRPENMVSLVVTEGAF